MTTPENAPHFPGAPVKRGMMMSVRHELIGLGGIVERNVYLTRRYIWWDLAFFVWTVANTLSIVFIAKGIKASGGSINVDRATTTLLIGAVVWAYLGIIFEFITEPSERLKKIATTANRSTARTRP